MLYHIENTQQYRALIWKNDLIISQLLECLISNTYNVGLGVATATYCRSRNNSIWDLFIQFTAFQALSTDYYTWICISVLTSLWVGGDPLSTNYIDECSYRSHLWCTEHLQGMILKFISMTEKGISSQEKREKDGARGITCRQLMCPW